MWLSLNHAFHPLVVFSDFTDDHNDFALGKGQLIPLVSAAVVKCPAATSRFRGNAIIALEKDGNEEATH